MFGLTPLGAVHTLISLVPIVTGAILLIRDGRITRTTGMGRLYALTIVLTCVTGFGFFYYSSLWTKGQILGVVTLVTVVIAMLAGRSAFGRISAAVEVVAYSATFLFNMIPFFAQTLTRFPVSKPVFADDTAPGLAAINGVMFVLFLIGAFVQVRRLRR